VEIPIPTEPPLGLIAKLVALSLDKVPCIDGLPPAIPNLNFLFLVL
jgi:hypothetical protein